MPKADNTQGLLALQPLQGLERIMTEMNLYEFINISDAITFYAPDDDIAFAVALYVGNGQCHCKRIEPDGDKDVKDSDLYLFGIPDEVQKRFGEIITTRSKEFIEAAHTFACCKPSEREIFNDYTNNGTDKEKYEKWDDAHRSSMSDYCKYARGVRLKDEGATK